MHDIALSVMGKECVTMVDNSSMTKLLPDPTRHAFVSGLKSVERIIKEKKFPTMLQTLLCEGSDLLCEGSDFRNLSKCTSLRALHIPGNDYEVLVKHLQHLRYLDLSGNWELEDIPEDIVTMYNLQTLKLSGCSRLRRLPNIMRYMASLRHLYTNGCKLLTCMPPGLGQITSLQTITYFVVGATSRCGTIGELRNLNNLGGELELSCLENATEGLAKEARLENKEKLTHLSLEWNSESHDEKVQDCHKKVLHALEPHDGLEVLKIVNYKGTSLPSWISDLSLLTELHLHGCVLYEEFPQFCHFNVLQLLSLEKLDKLQSLCGDAVSITFLALKRLRLLDLESLERWMAAEGIKVAFPVLENIYIKNCPKLTCLPEAPNLKGIRLDECKALLSIALVVELRRYMSSLSTLELSLRDTEEATTPQIDPNHESSLSELRLEGCNFFFSSCPSFGAWKWFGKLVTLGISGCDAMIYWPDEVFRSLVSLKNLNISSCDKLIGRTQVEGDEPTQTADQVLPHLNMIDIWCCENLVELFVLPPSLRTIYIGSCPRLEFVWGKQEHRDICTEAIQLEKSRQLASTSIPEQPPSPTNRCPCLETLYIAFCDKLATLPHLPPSLKALMIHSCEKLCSVSGQLDALESLEISSCSKLQSLDSLGDLPSLESLTLYRCRCLPSLPGVLGNYSALREISIKYCPAIDMKPIYKRHQHRLNSLEVKDISHAHSSDPYKGPKLREPRSWKYAIRGVSDCTMRRHNM